MMLAEAGAEVLKIEPPGGDPMRQLYINDNSGESLFEILNRGKRSLCIDLKTAEGHEFIQSQLSSSDVLIEQFRPGTMARLGLDYESVKQKRKDIIYCSLTGYGQSGEKALKAGHDLNYQTESGLLGLVSGQNGDPVLPQVLLADIAGGAYPAVMNILLAVMNWKATGQGTYLDIAMANNLAPFLFWAKPNLINDIAPRTGLELFTGGSPRYQLYKTVDNQWLAVAPLEERFWQTFCGLIGLDTAMRSSQFDAAQCIERISQIIAQRSADEWLQLFEGEDVCCSIVTLPHAVAQETEKQAAVASVFTSQFCHELADAPALGEANSFYGI
jgi:crotonobetainyl-CoA:carnitine CoA-transferase CaiB-like acyl-CoA transferase